MRILQLIDSLEAGGAERMAVNYANVLQEKLGFSALVSTRREGFLKDELDENVPYLFLKKKRAMDIAAIFRLKKFVNFHKIDIIHAHSSSYFTAVLVSLLSRKLKIIWHDHYGNSDFLKERKIKSILFFSRFFDAIIAVNTKLQHWAKAELYCKNVFYLPNFVFFKNNEEGGLKLNGDKGKRILLLANLRSQKNHEMLLKVAGYISIKMPEWSFHLVGKDFDDEYSKKLKKEIISRGLSKSVFVYGTQDGVATIIKQSSVGILTSRSEGLPVALLEYGYFGLPVIATNVGEISNVIENKKNGYLVESNDVQDFSEKLEQLLKNEELRIEFATNLQKTIFENYTPLSVVAKYQKLIEQLN